MPVYRVDFHHHVGTDPMDPLRYSARDLILAAIAHGIHAIAVTPHRDIFHDPDAVAFAAERGLLLIPGVEKLVEGREVLVLNLLPGEVRASCSFAHIRELRARRGGDVLVVAPHPYFPRKSCLREKLAENADCFDAVEQSHFYGFGVDYNRKALAWAKQTGKPVLPTSDTHDLAMVGRNYAEVDALSLTPRHLFEAIRAGAVRPVSRPHTLSTLAHFGACVLLPVSCRKIWRRLSGRRPANH